MLDIMRATGTLRREIVVQTHTGRAIRNYIAPPPSQADINCYYGAIRRRTWKPRKDAVGIYNCAGMVWASRRTCLPEPDDWEAILADDGYRKLPTVQESSVGDVVVYRSTKDRKPIHIAKICTVFRLSQEGEPVIEAISKWDQRCGEDVHRLEDVHLNGGEEFSLEIWTDRPVAPDERIKHIENLPRIK